MHRKTTPLLLALSVAVTGCEVLKSIDDAVSTVNNLGGSPCEGASSWPQVKEDWGNYTVTLEGSYDGHEAVYRAREQAQNDGRKCTGDELVSRSVTATKIVGQPYPIPLRDAEVHYEVSVDYIDRTYRKPK